MKSFTRGVLFGVVATAGAVVGAILSFKKQVVDPVEQQETKFDDSRKKALRKSRSAHQQ